MDSKRIKPMLAVLYASAFVAAYNENIVNVGLPDIMSSFSVDAGTANWLVTGYMIVSAVVIAAVAFLMRRFTLRGIYGAAAVLFIAGCAGAYWAPSFALLLGFRLTQALGTGMFIPLMMTSVLALAPRGKLGTYLSIGGCCITFGPAFGPVISGLMVTLFGWRAMFAVPCVAMAILLACGLALIRNYTEPEHASLDVLSLVLSAVGITALVYGLSLIMSNIALALAAIAVGSAVLAVFARRQFKLATPLLNMTPFKQAGFSRACVLVVVAMMTTFSMSVLLPLFFETAFGMSALAAGLLILLPIILNAGTAIIGGRVMDKVGEWPLLPVGFTIIVVGQAACALLAGQSTLVGIVAAASVTYAGVGLVFTPSQTSGLKTLSPELHPHGVSLLNTLVMIAAALGPSLFVGVLSHVSDGAGGEALGQAAGFSAAVTLAAGFAVVGLAVSLYHAKRCNAQKPATAQPAQAADGSTLRAIMKTDVFSLRRDQPVVDALKLFADKGISGAPVVDDAGVPVGFISDGDIMQYLADQVPAFKSAYSFVVEHGNADFDAKLAGLMGEPIAHIAHDGVITVDASADMGEVARLLAENHLKKAPVMEDGRMVGIINRSNVTKYSLNWYFANQSAQV